MTSTAKLIAWLLAGVATAAVAGGAYYVTRDTAAPPAQIAAAPAEGTQPDAAAKSEPEQQVAALPGAKEEEPVLPAFDLLRVEKDGSTVVAGSAAPNTKVELLDGDRVLASGEAGPEGDFALVLEEPLPPGAYELGLRSIGSGGVAVLSEETGIVSVPETGGELIAMVAKPGEASRIMQKPEEPGSAVAAAPASGDAAPAGQAEEQQADEQKADEQKSEQAVAGMAAPAAEPAGEPAAGEPPAEVAESQDEPAEARETETAALAEPAAPAASAEAEAEQTQVAPAEAAPTEAEPAEAAPADAAAPPAEPAAPAARPVLVQAVDVENGRIFVAGVGEPGRSVNLYIDDRLIGTALVTAAGAFLLEAASELEPGRHAIRADMLAEDGASVSDRAEVALVHEPASPQVAQEQAAPADQAGQQVATAQEQAAPADRAGQQVEAAREQAADAVAQSAPAGAETMTGETAGEPAAAGSAVQETAAAAPEAAPAAPETAPATAQETAAEAAPAAGQEAAAAAAPATGQEAVAETAPASGRETGEAVPAPAAETVAEAAAPGQPAAEAAPAAESAEVAATDGKPADGEPPAAAPEQPREMAAAAEQPAAEPAPAVSQPQGEAAPADEIRTGASVIIRRGDNLWKISRRMLGRGIRYTVIYEANRDQIRDPRLIYPGQVFEVPGGDPEAAEQRG